MAEEKYTDKDMAQAEMMGRVTQSLAVFTDELKNNRGKMDTFENKLDAIAQNAVTRLDLEKHEENTKATYVTKDSFEPVRRIFYMAMSGVVGVMIALITGIVALIKYST